MSQLKRVKTPWGEAEWFAETVEDAQESAEDLPSSKLPPESAPVAASEDDVALELARIDPGAAVVTAFIRVERAAVHLLEAIGEPVSRSPMVSLRKSDRIDPYLKSLIIDLSQLRNAAAHGGNFPISLETARRYIEAANLAAKELEVTASAAKDDEL
jgi:hypothetical protein